MLYFKDICKNSETLGMENGKILDSQIAASSHWNDQRDLTTARLKLKQTGMGAWSAGKNDVNQWMHVDFKNKAI